jgi:hypothetical protein
MVVDEELSTFIHAAPPAQSPARLVPQNDDHWAWQITAVSRSAPICKKVQAVSGHAIEI